MPFMMTKMSIPKIDVITGRHMDEVHIEAMRIIVNRGHPARDAAIATVHPDMRSDVYAYVTGYVIGAGEQLQSRRREPGCPVHDDPHGLNVDRVHVTAR